VYNTYIFFKEIKTFKGKQCNYLLSTKSFATSIKFKLTKATCSKKVIQHTAILSQFINTLNNSTSNLYTNTIILLFIKTCGWNTIYFESERTDVSIVTIITG